MSAYNVMPQNEQTSRKLSQGSPVVHVKRPATLFSGRRNGCEYARARVICGGVAMRRGVFWWTSIADRCFEEVVEVDGVKAAMVGGSGAEEEEEGSPSLAGAGLVREVIQGVSRLMS